MARQYIFNNNDIEKVEKAYLFDVLFSHDNNFENDVFFKISGDEFKHILVLRYKVEDTIIVNNMECKILYISKKFAILNMIKKLESVGIPNINLTVYQAFLKNDKMDFLVQKLVEIGAKTIVPFFSKNTIVKLDDKDKIKRKEKLQKITLEAIKQCGRTDDVLVNNFLTFKELFKDIQKQDLCIFAYENETNSLKEIIENIQKTKRIYKNISIIVGPEGGFDIQEVNELKKLENVYTVSLGERILRAETACLNLASIIMYELD
ncbi:MAG: 16S rRNA (uracil(1498)-N(3))-methyltransferase [Clostridia bacterium]